MLYTPLLPGAAAGVLAPRHVTVPLREQLPDAVDLRLGRITGATPERNALQVENLEGKMEDLSYDQLVVTVGSVSRTLPIPGLAEHGRGFKSLSDSARGGEPCPPTAQHAIRQGRVVARNVAAALGPGGRKRAFKYKTKGVFVDMGRREAVAMTGPVTWSGTPAWVLARTYHLAAMPGMGRRARLLVDWNIGLLFGRDTAELGGVAAVKPPDAGLQVGDFANGKLGAGDAPDAAVAPR